MFGDGQPKDAGTWDWYGSGDPNLKQTRGFVHWETFSVGVFQWQPKGSRKGTKKGASIKRFNGPVSDPESVYEKARAFIATQM